MVLFGILLGTGRFRVSRSKLVERGLAEMSVSREERERKTARGQEVNCMYGLWLW